MVVKAATQGSSIGTIIVRERNALPGAIKEVFCYDDELLAEKYITGIELTVPVMSNEKAEVLPIIEVTSENEFYDYDSKYTPGKCSHIIPARINDDLRSKVEELSIRTFKAMGCRGVARIDFMVDKYNNPFVLEVNTIPGMTEMSLVPDSARTAGFTFEVLVEKIIKLALEKSKESTINMKKVCHMTSAHSYNDTRIFLKECHSLNGAGYDVSLIVQHEKDEIIDGIKILGIPKPKNRRQRMLQTTGLVYKKALECDADIYHFHDPELIPVGLKLKRNGKKVIYDVHEDVPQQILGKQWIPKIFRRIISYVTKEYTNYAVNRFDAVVGATPHITKQFESINSRAVNINNYPMLKELFIPELEWSKKERAVCYVGGIAVERGIYNIVNTMDMLDARLYLAGEFENEIVRNNACVLPGWSNIDELGQINREEVKDVFAKSVAGLLLVLPGPNVFGALPNKMFEYMSAGIAQVTSNDPLWKNLIEECECGLTVDPTNTKQIAEAINYLLTYPMEAEQMGRNGRKAVEEKYNWEAERPKLVSLYKELLV